MSVKQGGKTIAGATQYHPDLFDFKRADHILNDAQWLMADTFSWQYGSMYQAAYPHLAADIDGKTLQSETIFGITIQFYLADDGHKICPASEEDKVLSLYNKIGVAWYYIIDTTNQRFKLPRESAEFLAKADYIDYTHPIEVTNGGTSSVYGWFYISGHSYSGQETVSLNGQVVYWGGNSGNERLSGDCILWVKPGDVISWATWNGQVAMSRIYPAVKSGISAPNEKYLYFYVGAFTQTAIENTAGLNAELFNGKADVNLSNTASNIDFVVERQEPTAANNYTWYRKYKSGWLEQGGFIAAGTTSGTVSIPLPYSDKHYQVKTTPYSEGANFTTNITSYPASASHFTWNSYNNSATTKIWESKGMAA